MPVPPSTKEASNLESRDLERIRKKLLASTLGTMRANEKPWNSQTPLPLGSRPWEATRACVCCSISQCLFYFETRSYTLCNPHWPWIHSYSPASASRMNHHTRLHFVILLYFNTWLLPFYWRVSLCGPDHIVSGFQSAHVGDSVLLFNKRG